MPKSDLNTKLLHNALKSSGACHAVRLLMAVKGSAFAGAGSAGKASCLKPGALVATLTAARHRPVERSKNAGSGWAILNSGLGLGINRKRFIAIR